MDIKLKRFSKKQKGYLIFAGWVTAAITAALAVAYKNYWYLMEMYYGRNTSLFEIASWILSVFSLLIFIFVLFQTDSYRKQWLTRETIISGKPDKMKLEILTAAAIISAVLVIYVYFDARNDLYILGSVIDNVFGIFTFILKFGAELVIFCLSVLFLYRRWILGTVKETSVIYGAFLNYRQRTPLEKRIQKKNRAYIMIGGLVFLGNIIAIVYKYGLYGENWLAFGILALVWGILFFKIWISNSLFRETGKLVQQIERMSQGETIPNEMRLSENSLLYQTDVQLFNIESAMEKSVEKQMQAERLKVDLITNMSHDLKTPLTSMGGYTDLLKKEELSDAARDYVDVIALKQEQLRDMIQDLFDLSKATSGSEQLNMEVLDMRKLLEQTLGDMEDAIEARGQKIRCTFQEESLLFTGDNGKMYRVVQNLIENALKYSLRDTRIYISAGKKEGKVYAVIKNIAAYEMDFQPDEIMERFVRGDKARTTKGHGLGLAIASSYVKNMKGNLTIEIDGDLFKVNMEFPCTEEK